MANISQLYTPQTATSATIAKQTPVLDETSGLFATPDQSAAGSFLDMLITALSPNLATVSSLPMPALVTADSEQTDLAQTQESATETAEKTETDPDSTPLEVSVQNTIPLQTLSPAITLTTDSRGQESRIDPLHQKDEPASENNTDQALALSIPTPILSMIIPPVPAEQPTTDSSNDSTSSLTLSPNTTTGPTPDDTPDPLNLNDITAEDADYTQTLDARLTAQVLALTKQNGTDPSTAPVSPLSDPFVDISTPSSVSQPRDGAETRAPDQTVRTVPDITPEMEPTNEIAAQLNALNISGNEKQSLKTTKDKPATPAHSEIKIDPAKTESGYQPNPVAGDRASINPQSAHSLAVQKIASLSDADSLPDNALFKIDLSALAPNNMTGLATAETHLAENVIRLPASSNAASTTTLNAVILHLQNMAQNRDVRVMTLNLNPPELGKLQVKMTFGKDKTVKADVLVEKSDTLNLLQKDTDNLKQALNNAGLSTDAGSLNLSLADHGAFNNTFHQTQDGNGTNLIVNPDGSDIALIEIKASEEWSVDPRTGIVRYNIVV